MTFEEQAAELARLEALAKSLGLADTTFNRIALEVMQDAHRSNVQRPPEQVFDEIRRRITPPGTRKAGEP